MRLPGGDATAGAPPALEARGVGVVLGGKRVLHDVDATFPAGTLGAIVGPNGAGKSTLLRAALGLVAHDAGTLRLLGREPREALRRVAYVPQRDAVDWDFPITVREVVEMGRYRSAGWLRRLSREERRKADDALEHLRLGELADRQIGRLSGGQQQRTFLARAVAQDAELLVMDEPFAGVDATTEAAVLELLARQREQGRSALVVHHDLATVRRHFDHVLLVNETTVAQGPVDAALTPEAVGEAYGTGSLAWAT